MSQQISLRSAVKLALATGYGKSSPSNPLRRAAQCAILTGAAAAVAVLPPVYAQDPAEEEIVVTGTRIVRQDYQAASPVVSLDAETFAQTGTINAEQLVNTLPQVVPSFSAGNNNPGNGQSWINLRGLGAGRNLVLIDGKRVVPSNEDGIVDINTIPTGMIERVEILSGGASAVYGSDAIAGATNFILRDDIDGVELTAQTGQSYDGDTQVNNVELIMGSPLADGAGHVTLWATWNDRDLLSKGDRAFSRQAVSETSFFPSGTVFQAQGNNWTLPSVQNVFTTLYGASAPTAASTLVGNDDGTLFTQGSAGEGVINFREVIGQDISGLYVAQNYLGSDGACAAGQAQVLDPNVGCRYSYNFEPFNNLVTPQERLNLGTNLTLNVSDTIEAYGRILFTNYSSDIRLAPSPAPTGANITNPLGPLVQFTVPVTNPFVQANAGLSQILASRTGDNAVVPGAGATEDMIYRRRFIENGSRIESYERDVWQFIGGLRGDISDSWNFDFFVGRGKYNEQLTQGGNVSVTRVESLLDAPDGGVSICAGGLNPIGANTLSPECADYVSVLAKNTTRIEHNLAELVFSGDIFELPGGTSALAFGASYQRFDLEYLTDEILATGDVAGFNAEDNIIGQTDQTDVFAELYLPVTERLGVTTGVRGSDHNFAGGNTSYKLEADYDVSNSWRVRSSFQRAVRAPGIGELFEPLVEDNPSVADPCNFDSSFRTGPNAAQVEALCVAQGILPGGLATYKQTTGQIDALQGGNLNLSEETADTYTLGFVWEPAVADDVQLSVDYYSIDIEDVITFINPTLVVNRCFNFDGSNPMYSNTQADCAKFGRSGGTGEINDLLELQENIGGLKTDGVDVQVDWRRSLGDGGDLGFNFVTTFVNEHSESPQPGEPFIDYVGTISQEVAEALPDFKATFTTLWDFRNFANVIRLRYLPSMEHRDSVTIGSTDPAICACTGVDSIVYVDASTAWQATEALTVRLGIDNLTDEKPELYTPDQDSGTNPTVYDVIGRRYFVTVNYRFGN